MLTLLRRIIIVLAAVMLAVLVTVLLLSPDSFSAVVSHLSETSALIRLPLAILVDVLALVILVLVFRSNGTRHQAEGLMVKAQGAIADVSVESVSDRILRAVRAVPDVLSAETRVEAAHGKADIDLSVVVSRQSMNLPEKQREIDRALRQVINKQLGLQMAGKPRVHIRLDDAVEASKTPVKPEARPETPIEPPKAEPPRPDTMNLRGIPGVEEKVETPTSDSSS